MISGKLILCVPSKLCWPYEPSSYIHGLNKYDLILYSIYSRAGVQPGVHQQYFGQNLDCLHGLASLMRCHRLFYASTTTVYTQGLHPMLRTASKVWAMY